MAETPNIPQFLPADGPELLADDALAAVATQVPATPNLFTGTPVQEPLDYGKTWAWDFSINRFVRNGGVPVAVTDVDTLKVWAQTVMAITRMAHPIYEDDIGLDLEASPVDAGVLANDLAAQQRYMESVSEALQVHDRITDVTNFDFYRDPADPSAENLYVDFEIHTDNAEVLPLTTAVVSG